MFALIVSLAVATANPCAWNQPGANSYRASGHAPSDALQDYAMSSAVREKLKARMDRFDFDEIVLIKRDTIEGAHAQYEDLRGMHSGQGKYCPGPVDRHAWSSTQVERGLVYCETDVCVVVPTVCNNVALLTRKPDDSPIDISPSAGPRTQDHPQPTASIPGIEDIPQDFPPVADNEVTPADDASGAPSFFPPPSQGFPTLDGGGSPPLIVPPPVPPFTVPEPVNMELMAVALLGFWLAGVSRRRS